MPRVRVSIAILALLGAGCGARSALPTEGTTGSSLSSSGGVPPPSGPPAHIYVTDQSDHSTVRVDNMAGSGWTTWGKFVIHTPCGVAVDAQDRIYFTEWGGAPSLSRIDDPTGAGYTVLVNAGSHFFAGPLGVALDAAGRIYVADTASNRIVRVDDISGAGWTALGDGQFDQPSGIAVSAEGRILVADSGNARLVLLDDMNGDGWQDIPLHAYALPFGVSFDRQGRIYAVDFATSTLHRFESDGSGEVTFTAPTAAFQDMSHVYVHGSDRIFLGSPSSGIAAMDDMAGNGLVTLQYAAEGSFNAPCGIFAK